MAYYLSPLAMVTQLMNDGGYVQPGLLMWTYAAGSTTPTPTWTDITGLTQNSNPIQYNAAGRLPNVSVWQQSGVSIKVKFSTNAGTVQAPVFGTQLGPTFDQITGMNDVTFMNGALLNPASGSGADLVANAVRSYDVFATARAAKVPSLLAGQTLIVEFEGASSVSDGLGGEFIWSTSSTATDDNIKVVKPTAISGGNPGRYLRRLYPAYVDWYAVKNVFTSIASNTTVANDPDLQITIPAAGTYEIMGLFNDATGSSAGGLKGQIAFSGSFTTGVWGMNGVGTAVTPVPLTAINTTATLQTAQTAVGFMAIEGALVCTTSGTLSFSWAQNSSNITASVLGIGSYLRATLK